MAKAFVIREPGIRNKLHSEVKISYNRQETTVRALWDTGATNSCISADVVSNLGLVATGKLPIQTPSGNDVVNTYLVDVMLPNDVPIPDLMVCDSKIGAQGIGMLIGMDIINQGDFVVSNYQGKTVFSFRMPSESVMDFVSGIKASNVIMANRNRKKNVPSKKKR